MVVRFWAVLLLGVISLLGDLVYEGGRSVIPDYLRFLGASAFVVGLVTGLGELVVQTLRLGSGYLADRANIHWPLILLGYGLIAAIPALSLTSTWELAAALIILERLGKSIRTPARDAVLSAISPSIGVGKTFGIHEAIDQVGAIAGPALIVAILSAQPRGYTLAFASTFPAFILLMLTLLIAYRKLGGVAVRPRHGPEAGGMRSLYLFTAIVSLNSLGLIYAPLILYRASEVLSPTSQHYIIPLIYLVIQAVDMPAALLSGILYDRYKLKILPLAYVLTIPSSIIAYISNDLAALMTSAVLFGTVLGMQESIYRAAVADTSGGATSYGVFNTALGLSTFLSGVIFGLLIDVEAQPSTVIMYVLATQAAALALHMKLVMMPKLRRLS